jgi:hypothetical protein
MTTLTKVNKKKYLNSKFTDENITVVIYKKKKSKEITHLTVPALSCVWL